MAFSFRSDLDCDDQNIIFSRSEKSQGIFFINSRKFLIHLKVSEKSGIFLTLLDSFKIFLLLVR